MHRDTVHAMEATADQDSTVSLEQDGTNAPWTECGSAKWVQRAIGIQPHDPAAVFSRRHDDPSVTLHGQGGGLAGDCGTETVVAGAVGVDANNAIPSLECG